MLSAGERPQPAAVNGTSVDPSSRPAVNGLGMTQSTSNSNSIYSNNIDRPDPKTIRHIWVVTGPAGSGKSTVGQGLRKELGLPFLEGDDFHPQANKDKMSNGIPLTDADRWDWLISLRKAAIQALSPSEENNFHPPPGVVVACSALKQKYRDVMRVAAYGSPDVQIHFIYLKVDRNQLYQRVAERQSHYMKSAMVQSQLEALEEPEGEWDALTIDTSGPPDVVQKRVSEIVAAKLMEYQ